MKYFKFILLIIIFSMGVSYAQFPGAAGTLGSTAIFKDSSIFVSWASTCTVQRGYQDIADISLGYVTTGDSSFVIGQADGIQVVSLGDGGSAVVGFEKPIKNGPGFDFAIFENGFIDEFLELAFVEVSSDGVNFYRFKATSNTQTDLQMGPFDYNADAKLINNLAGKYRAMYGTPFDLEEMIGISGLNVDAITHIKVIDVIGSINPLYASYDENNHIINEHYPTPYPQGGFDLDAIGVIHQQVNGMSENKIETSIAYPNPFEDVIYLKQKIELIEKIELLDFTGKIIYQYTELGSPKINLSKIETGSYLLVITLKTGILKYQKVTKIKP